MVRRWMTAQEVLGSIVPILVVCVAVKFFSGPTWAVVLSVAGLLFARFLAWLSETIDPFKMIAASVPIGAGIAWLTTKDSGATFEVAFISLFVPHACMLIGLLWHWSTFLGTPVTAPVVALISSSMNRTVERKFPAWRACSLVFQRNAIRFNTGNKPVFVASKSLRREGEAQRVGTPVFTYAQFSNRALVASTMQAAIDQAQASGAEPPQWLNPATGLPTVGNIAGGIDVGGNQWGHNQLVDINPGSGLPTIGGPGTIDVAGNAWGHDNNM
ncbi:hypothetical protein LMG27952_06887 [Paraburkholderia hiiakae]|uniref:Uncharacterized protein n=2 Tax=Paraburkholderia hiiakae TaxID=1081782 RepID=A0ABM8P931_9BURK|nr:hypothetical protein LMG27952_06887 [Paraburkholderia hiiakae]